MASYLNRHRYLTHRDRDFHFVSYDGLRADPRRGQEATVPTWFLTNAGKRWPVMPQSLEEGDEAVDARLIAWLEQCVFNGIA